MYPNAKVWRTETPLCSKRNLNFYINKLGFMAYRIDEPMYYENAQVQLEHSSANGSISRGIVP